MDWRILYNPMAVLRRGNALLAALIVIIILTAVAWWGGEHLDGALDLHIAPTRPSAGTVALESLIDWFSLAILLFAASRLFGGNGGLARHFAATGLGRFPMILAAVIGARQLLGAVMLKAFAVGAKGEIVIHPEAVNAPAVIIGGLLIVGFVAWSVTMLVFGFKEVSRLQNGKLAAGFVIGIILAEIVSKLILWGGLKIGI